MGEIFFILFLPGTRGPCSWEPPGLCPSCPPHYYATDTVYYPGVGPLQVFTIREQGIVMSVSVCVCLSVQYPIIGTTSPIFSHFFLHVFPMAVARFSSGGVVICTSVMFAHKLSLLDVAAQLKRSAHAALGLVINCAQFVVKHC